MPSGFKSDMLELLKGTFELNMRNKRTKNQDAKIQRINPKNQESKKLQLKNLKGIPVTSYL